MSKFALSQRSYFRLWRVHPSIIRVLEDAIDLTAIDFGVAYMGGFRTEDEQRQLFIQGVSKADGEIHMSKHQTGDAVDLIIFVDGKALDPKEEHYTEMLCVVAGVVLSSAKRLGVPMKWGGDWGKGDVRSNKSFDPYHFEFL